ncbi:MAG: GTP pyrophosphokinase [Bacillus sp. (in: firmicutes)]
MAEHLLEKAIILATEGHTGQTDKGGSPYILHPLRVMRNVSGYNEKMVAVLHDIIEDTSCTLDDLRQEGFPDEILEAVDAITKRPGESYGTYLERVAFNPLAKIAKIADLKDNSDLSRLPEPTDEDRRRAEKYKTALQFLLGD